MKKTMVVSAINATDSGVLSIVQDTLRHLVVYAKSNDIRIIALVHDKDRIQVDGVEYVEFKHSKKSWLLRIYYEYFHFKKLSVKLKTNVWLSLHDMSPRVTAKKRFVYFHNPTPFFSPTLKDWWFGPKIALFSLFYHWIYRINIHSNDGVIVQQKWFKDEIKRRFNFPNVMTAHPQVTVPAKVSPIVLDANKTHFFYPAFPRMFKNFELIGQAVSMLPPEIRNRLEVHLTLDGRENRYARSIKKRYGHLPAIHFTGILNRKEVWEYYQASQALIFPSRLETWGLPMTEFRSTGKPIFAANLSYARETLGGYDKSWFFELDCPKSLARLMEQAVLNQLPQPETAPAIEPDFLTWERLFDFILKD